MATGDLLVAGVAKAIIVPGFGSVVGAIGPAAQIITTWIAIFVRNAKSSTFSS
jgi:hypothetical protein